MTLKNIYGALPLANKFKEYHCDRDIYHTTIEYLTAFPVHFGLVDAYLSADGPFGIFADTRPNQTYTIIGGEDLVAVDWVGAAKMGLDPMVSEYMQLAAKTFGKPEIHMLGDRTLYPDWVNVPDIISSLAFGLDKEYNIADSTSTLLEIITGFTSENLSPEEKRVLFMNFHRSFYIYFKFISKEDYFV